jgi:hypothetical protein
MRRTYICGLICACAWLTGAVGAAPAQALTSTNNTPFPNSAAISGAFWTSARHGPPSNQFGDILPTPWADDDDLYVLIDDGGTSVPQGGALWRNSFAQIVGSPLHLRFRRIGVSPPPATRAQIRSNPKLWTGPLGPYYSTGFAVVNDVFYATQVNDWKWGSNSPFAGLAGIAYSTDHGAHWQFPRKSFPAATGNLNWIQSGRARLAPDGYLYAIATEKEFNASTLILGRSRPDIADVTDPSRWQWASGWQAGLAQPWPTWTRSIADAKPILSWPGHITYPRMSYDQGLHRYLLTFTYSYAGSPPGVWRSGAELVILDSPHPWGPFTFVTRGHYFGPSNGYDPAFPVKWISPNGLDLWMIWAANFDGCAAGLNCSGAYGFNYQRLHMVPAAGARRAASSRVSTRSRARPSGTGAPPRPASWRGLPATPPPYGLPRLGAQHP